MVTAPPTWKQVHAQVTAVKKRVPDARVFGIHAQGPWAGETRRHLGAEVYEVFPCATSLQIREALQADRPDVTAKVLLTPLNFADISLDILVRVANRRFYSLDAWKIVADLFQARKVDPRISELPWMADRLLDLLPPHGFAPVPSGFLDRDTAWSVLLKGALGIEPGETDLPGFLAWSASPDNSRALRLESPEFLRAFKEWMEDRSGPVAGIVVDSILQGGKADALPAGLALGVIFHESVRKRLQKAAGRMEAFVGGNVLNEHVGLLFHEAARNALDGLPDQEKSRAVLLGRSDEILESVEADFHAWISDCSPLGFRQRQDRLGRAILEDLGSGSVRDGELESLLSAVRTHSLARTRPRTLARAEMALRLLRWIVRTVQGEAVSPGNIADLARSYVESGGFVDWARQVLRGAEESKVLTDAFRAILDRSAEAREKQNRAFGESLASWMSLGNPAEGVLPVEFFLEKAVAPVLAEAPALLVVMDGMSHAVFRELIEEITVRDWIEVRPEKVNGSLPVIAMVPSTTQLSRGSLFCGKPREAGQADEQKGFAAHASLRSHCKKDYPPLLFHKQAFGDMTLVDELSREIASENRRIVAVVINAVDDHLAKGEQTDPRWTRDYIKVLPPLLNEARAAGRSVVLVSDHGHVLEAGTEFRSAHEERHRSDDGKPEEGEIVVKGPRVVYKGKSSVIVPWSEKIRYTKARKNGYHGGASPQEMVIPWAVLCAADRNIKGYAEAPRQYPVWWDAVQKPIGLTAAPEPETAPAETPKQVEFGFMPEPEETAPPSYEIPDWVTAFQKTKIYKAQKKLVARAVKDDGQIALMLAILSAHGGKMLMDGLARRLGVQPVRMRGFLAAMQRLLNLEGYAVLSRDDSSNTVELNEVLLKVQFEIDLKVEST